MHCSLNSDTICLVITYTCSRSVLLLMCSTKWRSLDNARTALGAPGAMRLWCWFGGGRVVCVMVCAPTTATLSGAGHGRGACRPSRAQAHVPIDLPPSSKCVPPTPVTAAWLCNACCHRSSTTPNSPTYTPRPPIPSLFRPAVHVLVSHIRVYVRFVSLPHFQPYSPQCRAYTNVSQPVCPQYSAD